MVVEQDRLVGRFGDLFVVAHDSARTRLVVVRRDAERRIDPKRGRLLGQVDGMVSVV